MYSCISQNCTRLVFVFSIHDVVHFALHNRICKQNMQPLPSPHPRSLLHVHYRYRETQGQFLVNFSQQVTIISKLIYCISVQS